MSRLKPRPTKTIDEIASSRECRKVAGRRLAASDDAWRVMLTSPDLAIKPVSTAYSEAIPYPYLNQIAPEKRGGLNGSTQH
jgi:hypothetical protein